MEEVDHLAHERKTAEFDVEAMKIVWAGSRRVFEVADRMSRLVASDPVGFRSIFGEFDGLNLDFSLRVYVCGCLVGRDDEIKGYDLFGQTVLEYLEKL